MKKLLTALFFINFFIVTTCQANISVVVPEEDFLIELDNRVWKLGTVMEVDCSSEKPPVLLHTFYPSTGDNTIKEIFIFTNLGETEATLETHIEAFTSGIPEFTIDNLQLVHLDDSNAVFTFSFVGEEILFHAIGHIYKVNQETFFGYYMDLECDDICELENHWTSVLLESADYFSSLITE